MKYKIVMVSLQTFDSKDLARTVAYLYFMGFTRALIG